MDPLREEGSLSMAKFYGIGVGVGSEYNVTKKAIDTLATVDVLYVPSAKEESKDSVAYEIVKSYIPGKVEVRKRHFPMTYDTEVLEEAWSGIAQEIIREVDGGKNVGFITIGDALVYSTYIYLLKKLKEEIEVETIAGITSFLDIAANCNFPLVEGNDALVVVPATVGIERIREYLLREKSVVLMKVYRNYLEIASLIEELDLLDYAIAVSNSSKKDQEIIFPVTGKEKDRVSYFTTILINRNWKYS
ncbi:MAG: precorrin-2 C(20)-methyltransferase [Filifactor alocis]|nr:precorrin-2 C(20)-methyltransferase [Filifactor alocis]